MIKIGYSLVDGANNEIDSNGSLPWSPPPPGKPKGRLASFTSVGQSADGYTVVERWATEPIHAHQVQGSPSVSWDGAKIVVDRNWTDKPIADVVASRVLEIKAIAQQRIVALVGATGLQDCLIKQLNANMRANELKDAQINGVLTPEEEAEATALRNLATAIKAIRAHSNQLEADVAALATVAEVVAWTDSGWPA